MIEKSCVTKCIQGIMVVILALLSFSAFATDELQAYIDGVVDSTMKDNKIVGLTLGVVADGEIKLLKGYGYADLESRTPVDPHKHLFRIASVTKTFTFTAIMQLVEQGKIDLEADVNDYLTTFKIPKAFDAPIKVKDLLAHRPGFEEVHRNVWVDADSYTSLEHWLADNIPARVFSPGTVTSYSNYGGALAGYIVEVVSGMSYEDYLETFILKPLMMTNTTAKQVLNENHPLNMPQSLQEHLAAVYTLQEGVYKEKPFEILQSSPSGAISSTVADMSRYMLAHLNGGELEGVKILERDTARQMHERPYPDRSGPDYAHGFMAGKIAGYTTFEHSGATFTSFTSMKMIPSLGLGVFISINGSDIGRGNESAAVHILEKMIQAPRPRPATVALSTEQAKAFTGKYMTTRRAYAYSYKIFNLKYGISTVAAGDNGSLVIIEKEKFKQYQRIGPYIFQQADGHDVITFELDDNGQAVRYYRPGGLFAYDRLAYDTNPRIFWLALMLACLSAFAYLAHIWRTRKNTIRTRYEKGALWLTTTAAIFVQLCVGFLLVYPYIMPVIMIRMSQLAAMLLGITALAMLPGSVVILKGNSLSIGGKILYLIFFLFLINMIVSLNNWHLIGPLLMW